MNRPAAIVVGAIAAGGLAAVAWLGFSPPAAGVDRADVPVVAEFTGTGPLDGMSFVGSMGPEGKPKDIVDRFVFANGAFASKECELRCNYPARPYFIREHDGKIDFVSETKCPYKDAKIIWRGTIDGDKIVGKSTWTVRRWYWTVESDFEFAGTLER